MDRNWGPHKSIYVNVKVFILRFPISDYRNISIIVNLRHHLEGHLCTWLQKYLIMVNMIIELTYGNSYSSFLSFFFALNILFSYYLFQYFRSSGVILYECLYGRAPFATDSYEKLIDQIKSHEPIKFPTNVLLSFDCMDLLQSLFLQSILKSKVRVNLAQIFIALNWIKFLLGLLVRNPNKRIRFENFFAHPFVNLYQGSFSTKELEKADEFIDISSQLERENVWKFWILNFILSISIIFVFSTNSFCPLCFILVF